MIVDCMRWYCHPSGMQSTINDHGNIQAKPPDLRTINVVYKTGSPNGRSGNMIITPQIRICKIIMCWYKCICSLPLPPDVRLMYIIRKIKTLKMQGLHAKKLLRLFSPKSTPTYLGCNACSYVKQNASKQWCCGR